MKKLALTIGALGLLISVQAAAEELVLPTATFPYAATYDDFNSYSLPIVNYYLNTDGSTNTIDCSAGDTDGDGIPNCTLAEGDAGYGNTVQNGEPGLVNSQPGELGKDGKYIVIATGTNNNGVNDNSDSCTNCDDAYRTDDGGSAGSLSFSTRDLESTSGTTTHSGGTIEGVQDPSYAPPESNPDYTSNVDFTPEFAGDLQDTWDINAGDLIEFLTDSDDVLRDMVIFFNHNELNSDADITGFGSQLLWGWSHVWASRTGDPTTSILDWYLQNTFNTYGTDADNPEYGWRDGLTTVTPEMLASGYNGGVIDEDWEFWSEWVLAAGQVCIDPTNVLVPNIGCLGDTTGQILFNHNLGADNAAYAIISDAINAWLAALDESGNADQYVLHFDIRLWSEDNGYEQIFIGALDSIENRLVPEPASLALLGAGLAAIGATRRRKKSQ